MAHNSSRIAPFPTRLARSSRTAIALVAACRWLIVSPITETYRSLHNSRHALCAPLMMSRRGALVSGGCWARVFELSRSATGGVVEGDPQRAHEGLAQLEDYRARRAARQLEVDGVYGVPAFGANGGRARVAPDGHPFHECPLGGEVAHFQPVVSGFDRVGVAVAAGGHVGGQALGRCVVGEGDRHPCPPGDFAAGALPGQ